MSILSYSSSMCALLAAGVMVLAVSCPYAGAEEDYAEVPAEIVAVRAFLDEFEGAQRRDPFKPFQLQKNVARTREPERTSLSATLESIVFNGSMPDGFAQNLSRMPRIRITGLMKVDGNMAACAEVENLGSRILHPGDRIVLEESAKDDDRAKWFIVRSIDDHGMLIELDDKQKIRGKFF
ncbi:MAG: hypothetical protein ACOCWR_10560 [Oceanidesulfovibrio sp.]